MTAPRCHNREPVPLVRTRHGIDERTGEAIAVEVRDDWSLPGCKTWSGVGIGPNNERYPEAFGWVPYCKTCRWLPAEIKTEMGL